MHKFGICRLGATILQRLEVEHPAAKVLVELAELQDSEVGDGTTSVVIIAAELLKRGTELVKNGIHPTTIMSGFRLALKEAVKFVKSNLMVPIEQLGDDALIYEQQLRRLNRPRRSSARAKERPYPQINEKSHKLD